MSLLNKIYLSIFLNILVINFFSQGLQLKFSEHISYSVDYKPIACYDFKNQNVLFQISKKNKFCDLKVNLFDNILKNKNQFNILIKNENFLCIRLFFDKIYLFTTRNTGNITSLKYRVIDLKSNISEAIELFSEPNKSGYPSNYIVSKKSFKDNFYVIAELPFQSGKQEDLKTITISSKMEIINQTYNKLELVFQSSRDNKIILSNDGEIYLLKKYWKNGNNFYIYKLGQEIILEREIKLKNKKIAALDYFFNPKGELVLSGFYSSQIRYNYEGFFLLKYDSELNIIHKNNFFFSNKIIDEFKSSKEIKESGFGLDKFIIKDFSLDSLGNYFLMSEHLSKTKVKNELVWNSNGFIVIKFNKNGNYIWGSPVPLVQQSENISFMGIFTLNNPNSIKYYYNNLSNLSLRKGTPAEYGIPNYTGTNEVGFNPSGIPVIKPISINFPGKDTEKYAFIPKQLNPLSNGPSFFIILNEKASNIMLGMVK